MPDQDSDTTALFRRSWSLYDFITERNYMFHRELYADIANLLRQRAESGPYRLLDLGCGNARYLAPCLKSAPPLAYTGIDLSAAALAEAETWLAPLPNIKLVQDDLLAAVECSSASCDIIFSGFALHHLAAADKQRFFYAAATRLTPGGWLLIIDVMRKPDQSRADYLSSYIAFMAANWHELPPDQFAEAQAHIEAHDYPEDSATLEAMGRAAGFTSAQPISSHGHHHALLFSLPT